MDKGCRNLTDDKDNFLDTYFFKPGGLFLSLK